MHAVQVVVQPGCGPDRPSPAPDEDEEPPDEDDPPDEDEPPDEEDPPEAEDAAEEEEAAEDGGLEDPGEGGEGGPLAPAAPGSLEAVAVLMPGGLLACRNTPSPAVNSACAGRPGLQA